MAVFEFLAVEKFLWNVVFLNVFLEYTLGLLKEVLDFVEVDPKGVWVSLDQFLEFGEFLRR